MRKRAARARRRAQRARHQRARGARGRAHAPGLPRRPHRPRQPRPLPRPARPRAGARSSARATRSRCCWSTSTASSRSTTTSATTSATSCSCRSPRASATPRGRATPSPASAATSSPCSSRAAARPFAISLAERLLERLSLPATVADRTLAFGASIGIVIHPADGSAGREELIRRADIAMYAAKKAGRGRYEVFRGEMAREFGETLGLEYELRLGLQRDEFTPPLPARDRGRRRRDRGRRGTAALDVADARRGLAGRVHPGSGVRPGMIMQLGAARPARGLRADRALGARGPAPRALRDLGQPLGHAALGGRHRHARAQRAGRDGPARRDGSGSR